MAPEEVLHKFGRAEEMADAVGPGNSTKTGAETDAEVRMLYELEDEASDE